MFYSPRFLFAALLAVGLIVTGCDRPDESPAEEEIEVEEPLAERKPAPVCEPEVVDARLEALREIRQAREKAPPELLAELDVAAADDRTYADQLPVVDVPEYWPSRQLLIHNTRATSGHGVPMSESFAGSAAAREAKEKGRVLVVDGELVGYLSDHQQVAAYLDHEIYPKRFDTASPTAGEEGGELQPDAVNVVLREDTEGVDAAFLMGALQELGVKHVNIVTAAPGQEADPIEEIPSKAYSVLIRSRSRGKEVRTNQLETAVLEPYEAELDYAPIATAGQPDTESPYVEFLRKAYQATECRVPADHLAWLYRARYLGGPAYRIIPLRIDAMSRPLSIGRDVAWGQVLEKNQPQFQAAMTSEDPTGIPMSLSLDLPTEDGQLIEKLGDDSLAPPTETSGANLLDEKTRDLAGQAPTATGREGEAPSTQ